MFHNIPDLLGGELEELIRCLNICVSEGFHMRNTLSFEISSFQRSKNRDSIWDIRFYSRFQRVIEQTFYYIRRYYIRR